jgi:OOP family OmpA-OmpF porin
MWRTAAVLAAVAAFLYVAIMGVKWLQPRIAEDIQTRATTVLAQHGMLWADVAVDGRTVILSGEAPSQEASDEAAVAVKGVFGVAVVSNDLVVSEAKPARKHMNNDYQITITKQGESLNISGDVPDENTQALLQRLAKTHYADAQVSTSLVVQKGAPAGWRSAVGTVLFNLTQFENVTATVIGDKIRINGEVLDTTYSDAAEGAIKAAIPTAYNMKMDVDVVTPTDVARENGTAAATSETAVVSSSEQGAAAVPETAPAPAVETEKAEPVAETSATQPTPESLLARMEKRFNAMKPASGTKVVTETSETTAPVAEAAGEPTGTCNGMDEVSKQVVHFDFDSAHLRSDQRGIVAKVASTVKACNGKVEVDGYTDATGSALYNKWLSEQRAESTVRGLIRKGVKREDTVAKGMGAENPVVPNDSREHRAQNRRVEFKVL